MRKQYPHSVTWKKTPHFFPNKIKILWKCIKIDFQWAEQGTNHREHQDVITHL